MKENKAMLPDVKCLFWALDSSKEECGITKGGMYIPMPEHVRMFCLSAEYYKCHQYIKGCELTIKECEDRELKFNGERRKLRRFADQLNLNLVVCDTSVEPRAIKACKAKTLDVSIGGLRLESLKELNTATVVSFELDPDFSSESLLGVGEVKWCEPKKNSDKFEFGVAFADYSTSKGIGKYLGLL